MNYPINRNRRLRKNASIRNLVAETALSVNDLIAPLFVMEGSNGKEEISSMPNYFRFTLDLACEEVRTLWSLGIKSVLLFVKVEEELKDNEGKEALNPEGLMQRSIRAIKEACPDIYLMTDVAMDPYSSYGHDGIVIDNEIVNDETIDLLAKMAVSHAEAGTDCIAPSDMMDGRIGRIREALELANFPNTTIMAYSAKYASTFYGPFRNALDSAPGFGDKRTYQMDFRNSDEGIREVSMDINEGADIVMIKPAMAYLDIIQRVKYNFNVPVAAYHVSGEYAMIKAAAEKGWINERDAVLESVTAIKRAGADLIATYFAKDIIEYLKNE